MLKINNLSKYHQGQEILKDINLEFESNEIVGLAGPSGSGKTTLLRCIQKLEKPDHGEIVCSEITGFMFQDFQLFPHMTVLQNLSYAPNHHKMKEVQSRAESLLTRLNIANKSHSYPSQLSGGQKQRVALARILMMEPTLLMFDEPTSGLDILAIREVIALLSEIKKSLNITMIIASHDLDFLTQISNRIIVLKNGKVQKEVSLNDKKASIESLIK